MRDLIEELGDAQRTENAAAALAEVDEQAQRYRRALSVASIAQDSEPVTVLCLPAHDEADEIVGLMLAQLLELKGQRAIAASQVSLAGEVLELVQEHEAAAVCISAFHRPRWPTRDISASGCTCDSRSCPPSLACGRARLTRRSRSTGCRAMGPSHLVTSVGAAIVEIHQMIQPLLLQLAIAHADDEAKPELELMAVTSPQI